MWTSRGKNLSHWQKNYSKDVHNANQSNVGSLQIFNDSSDETNSKNSTFQERTLSHQKLIFPVFKTLKQNQQKQSSKTRHWELAAMYFTDGNLDTMTFCKIVFSLKSFCGFTWVRSKCKYHLCLFYIKTGSCSFSQFVVPTINLTLTKTRLALLSYL